MAAETYEGRACINCGGVKRYASNKACVACRRLRSKEDRRRARAGKPRTRKVGNQGLPLPDKPDRKGWAIAGFDLDGKPVHCDPILHLGLGGAGEFE